VKANRFSLTVGAALVATLIACGGPSTKEELLAAGNEYFGEAKYREASILYRKAIQKDPRFGEAYYRLGLNELKQQRFQEALHALRRAAELQPGNTDAQAQLGELLLTIYLSDKERYAEFLTDYTELADRILERNPKAFEGLRMRGFQYVAEGKLEEAIAQFERAEAAQPGDRKTNLAWVQALAGSGLREEAVRRAEAFVERDPSFGPMYDFLYIRYIADRRTDAAEEILEAKVAGNPQEAAYRMELAAHYRRVSKRQEMTAALRAITSDSARFPRGHELVGDFYYGIEDFAAARREYEAGEAEDRDNKASYQKRLVDLLAREGRRDEALSLAQRIVRENHNDFEAQALLASLRMRSGSREDLSQSIEELQGLISRMPDNAVVRFNLGEALAARGDAEQARIHLEEAIQLRPSYLPPRLSLARLHMLRGEFPAARRLTDDLLALDPANVSARLVRTAALMGLRDPAGAREELARVLELVPENDDALYLRSLIDLSERRYDDAESTFRRLYKMGSPDLRGLMGLAEVALATGRPDEAQTMIERELAAGQDSRGVRLALANVLSRSGKLGAAASAYENLLRQEPDSAALNLRLGETYLRSGNHARALVHLNRAHELSPRSTAPLLKIASIYQATNQRAQLRAAYEAVLQIQPDNVVALNNMAYFLADGDLDLDLALTYAQKAKQQKPDDPDVTDTLGWVYIKKNLSDDAIRIFQELLVRQPANVTWRYHLATALAQKGDKAQAKKEIEIAMGHHPSPDERRELTRLLDRIG
jgi:tetratricopeptide (TPR) repeat protein